MLERVRLARRELRQPELEQQRRIVRSPRPLLERTTQEVDRLLGAASCPCRTRSRVAAPSSTHSSAARLGLAADGRRPAPARLLRSCRTSAASRCPRSRAAGASSLVERAPDDRMREAQRQLALDQADCRELIGRVRGDRGVEPGMGGDDLQLRSLQDGEGGGDAPRPLGQSCQPRQRPIRDRGRASSAIRSAPARSGGMSAMAVASAISRSRNGLPPVTRCAAEENSPLEGPSRSSSTRLEPPR